MSDDRRVHATKRNGTQIVRYERAGKWYAEHPGRPRRPLSFASAVDAALVPGTYVYLGLPGGGRFDAEVRRARRAR